LAVGSSWPPVSKGPETGPVRRGTRWAADSQKLPWPGAKFLPLINHFGFLTRIGASKRHRSP
jgi:hypothetical protein